MADNPNDYKQPGMGEQAHSHKAGESVSVGVGGYKTSGGQILDDFLDNLNGERGRRVFRQMKDNDPTIGALLTAIEMMLRAVEFRFEPAEADMDNRYVTFAETQFEDMEYSWDETLTEILTMLPFGFAIMEMVFKRRDDGLITTARLAPRSQETIWEWDIDEHGDVRGVWQWPPNGGNRVYIPYEQVLHFRTKLQRGNPEGNSVLRNAYTSYHYVKNIETIEAIAIERELAGMPVAYIPAAAFKDATVKAAYESIVRDVKKNSQGGVVMPSNPYVDNEGKPTNTQQYRLELLSASGSRSIDTGAVITRHQQNMVRTVLADFLMLGSGDKGSFALSKSKTDLFLRSVDGYLGMITDQLNQKWIKTLWALNGFPDDMRPTLKAGNVAPVDLAELGTFLRDSGLMATMDMETENYVREVAGLPKVGDGEEL